MFRPIGGNGQHWWVKPIHHANQSPTEWEAEMSWHVSEEDEIQRGSAMYSRSHSFSIKRSESESVSPSQKAMMGWARCLWLRPQLSMQCEDSAWTMAGHGQSLWHFFSPFFSCTHGMWRLLGQGSNLLHSSDSNHRSNYTGSLPTRSPGNAKISVLMK